jgi:radical SAM protein with 4Fe4S-binding SPASM domain
MDQVFQTLNSHKAITGLKEKVMTPDCFPVSIFLETTNHCNLSCPLCPTGSGKMTREKGILKLKTAEKVFEETTGFIDEIVLSFYGEPFLHPKIIALIKSGKSYKHKIKLFTNLNLSPKEGWETFIQTGIDHIVVSLDGIDSGTYSSYRIGGNFANVIANLKSILSSKSNQHVKVPLIEIQMLALKQNERQYKQFLQLCEEYGVDVVKLKFANLGEKPTIEIANQFLPVNKDYHYYNKQIKIKIRQDLIKKSHNFTCKELYLGPAIISWNGDFILCCRDHNNKVKLGSINKKTIWDFWNGEEMSLIRENQKKSESRFKMCSTCPALFLNDFSIKKTFINQQFNPQALNLWKPVSKNAISSNPYQEGGDYVHICYNYDIGPLNLEPMGTNIRKFQKGDIIDYGSYRTFKL